MALCNDVTRRGIFIPGAYQVVSRPTVSADKTRLGFSVVTSSAYGEEPISDETYIGPYSLDGENPFVQAYEFLKTLAEFAGAVDC